MSHSSQLLCDQQYENVKRLAYAQYRRERWTNTYHATDLAHDALLRLGCTHRLWPNIDAFISAASETIRCVLIDRHRRKNAKKRIGKKNEVAIGIRQIEVFDRRFSEIEIEELIDRYSTEVCHIRGSLVRMRWNGYKRAEITSALEISSATYDRYLATARKRICLWLLDQSDEVSASNSVTR